MNREFVTLSDEQLEMVVGGATTQEATAVSYSTQDAAIVLSDVANVGKGDQTLNSSITQSAHNIAVAANAYKSFNRR